MNRAGFEPAPPKRIDLKSTALDHSANGSLLLNTFFLNKSQDFLLLYVFFVGSPHMKRGCGVSPHKTTTGN